MEKSYEKIDINSLKSYLESNGINNIENLVLSILELDDKDSIYNILNDMLV